MLSFMSVNAIFSIGKKCAIFSLSICTATVFADQGLLLDFQKAKKFDPTYAAALVDNSTGQLQAKIAGMAYFPEARLSSSQMDNENSSRLTFSLSQPLLNYDRWLLLKEADPRMALAAVKLSQSHQDLAQRLFKSVASVVDAREKLALNKSSLEAIGAQVSSASQAFKLGLGTITDVRDAQVRLAQTRSQSFSLRATLDAAERQFFAVVGQKPRTSSYVLTAQVVAPKLGPLSDFLQRAETSSPAVLGSQLGIDLADIGTRRARASLYPSVTAFAQRSQTSGSPTLSNSGVALRMEIPLQAGSFFKGTAADFELAKTQELARNTLQQTRLDVERLYSQLAELQSELEVRSDVIKAAELSLQANEQSFQGGVRTKIDVLNALQALYQTRADYASAQLRMGEIFLGLLILSAEDSELALSKVQAMIFVQ